MDMPTYIKESARTQTDKIYMDAICSSCMGAVLAEIEEVAEIADQAKKALFYGKVDGDPGPADLLIRPKDVMAFNTLHALLGIVSEVGEFLEAGEDLDRKTVVDEGGDILWYLAQLFRAYGVSFEEVAEANIAKLRVRFPDKCTADQALNRNEAAEQNVFAAYL